MYQIASRCRTKCQDSVTEWVAAHQSGYHSDLGFRQTWISIRFCTQLSVPDQWLYLAGPFCQLGNEVIPVAPQAGRSEDGEGKALPTVCRQSGRLIGIASSTVRAAKAKGKQPLLPGLCSWCLPISLPTLLVLTVTMVGFQLLADNYMEMELTHSSWEQSTIPLP